MTERLITFEVTVRYPDGRVDSHRFEVIEALVHSSPDTALRLVKTKLATIAQVTAERWAA